MSATTASRLAAAPRVGRALGSEASTFAGVDALTLASSVHAKQKRNQPSGQPARQPRREAL